MRIIAGRLRGRRLTAPDGDATRPTSDRARQALFDMLVHSPWAEGCLRDVHVLDGFAGTGALGLEALSRGAARVTFIDNHRPALAVLRINIAACKAEEVTRVIAADARKPPRGDAAGLVFLDPPYGQGLVPPALTGLAAAGWIAPGALIIAEIGAEDALPTEAPLLVDRRFGAARICVWQATSP
ncbi:16S rRNA (guanine(966)-N(2))-methyltransferase RsmD [Acidisoma cellulosilytica]|uniref:16S rRNA (Guanine(966)-N(2))-methyltransferase RsmD n=1 Tax=Acidisoma cellulosilyticum TaxID=2802395 RepID=A0A963YZC8_9PROT|nr:16S rRNA (guanine(966)-N(2))-methyltransferase RsmD [Acidisoma cellulosilyticum]MCB8879716.1 16S rRNA (guanine(966)-N(2))-methyltransferase RsmD [Acidisoma cellulosilyticum]